MKTAQTLQPQLRFPEFEDDGDWIHEKLGSLTTCHNNARRPITAINRVKGSVPYYGASGIVDYVNDFIFDTPKLLIGEDGAKWGSFESTAFIVKGKYWVNNHAHVFSSLELELRFIENYLVMLDIAPFVTGAAPPKLTLDNVRRIPIPCPPSEPEQQKIADCLGSLDELLTAHRSKLTALQDHKKGLLQQLFPPEDQTTPNLRFPEFKDDGGWIATALKDVFSIFQGYAFSSNDSCNSGARWLKIADVGIQKMSPSSPSFLPEGHTKEHSRFIVSAEDLVVALTRPFLDHELKIAKVDSIYDGALLNQRVGKILPKEKSDFVYYLLQTSRLTSAIEKQISGNDPPNLSSYQIEDIETLIPKPNEQQKIADCLSDLDALITAETKSIEVLQTHKKGLMQQLFPQ